MIVRIAIPSLLLLAAGPPRMPFIPADVDAGLSPADVDARLGPGADVGTRPTTDAGTRPTADAGTRPTTDAGTRPTADAGRVSAADAGRVSAADAGRVSAADAGPSTAAAPVKPPLRRWTVRTADLAITAAMRPGVPEPGQLTEVEIAVDRVPERPHPEYGYRIPVEGARLTVSVAGPSGQAEGRYLTHPMPLAASRYGLHVTVAQPGIHTLAIHGATAEGAAFTAEVKLPVHVWPLPPALEGTGDTGAAPGHAATDAAGLPAAVLPGPPRPAPGDAVNGRQLYLATCARCHGEDAHGGTAQVPLTDSGRLNLLTDAALYELIERGGGTRRPREHSFGSGLAFLDGWDLIAYLRTLHRGIEDFFPKASRYIANVYRIDEAGVKRIERVTGRPPAGEAAPVFTFFDFPGEEGRMQRVPAEPIQLDQLKKDKKVGYLVFLPFEAQGYRGEIGIATDRDGKITALQVTGHDKVAAALDRALSRFRGLGQKGDEAPFKIGGGLAAEQLAGALFPVYLRAMETVLMYDREEAERTWAD